MSKKNSNRGLDLYDMIPLVGTLSFVAIQISLVVFAFVSLIKGLVLAWAQGALVFLAFVCIPPVSTVSGAIWFVAGVDIPKAIMVELRSNQGTQTKPVITPAN